MIRVITRDAVASATVLGLNQLGNTPINEAGSPTVAPSVPESTQLAYTHNDKGNPAV